MIDYQKALNAYLSLIPGAEVSSPQGQEAFNAFWGSASELPDGAFDAAMQVLAKPDQRDAFVRQYGGNMKAWVDSFTGWWGANGHTVSDKLQQFGPEMALIDALGFKVNPEAVSPTSATTGAGAVPLEQQLFNKIIQDYIGPDLTADAARRAEATQVVTDINRSLDTAVGINNRALDGTRLREEQAMADETAARLAASAATAAQARLAALDQRKTEMTAALTRMQADRGGALDAQTEQLRGALATLETERKAALDQLNSARLAAAEGRVTAINQGLQSERDRIVAEQALQGFVGGSAMQDANLARATIGARSAAAQEIGGAKVANAGDSRALADEVANARFSITGNDATERRGIADETARGRFNLDDALSTARVANAGQLATEQQGARDTGTRMRTAYFDNDFTRSLTAALVPAQIGATRLGLIDIPGQVGQSGLTRTLNNLNWFSATPAMPTASPTTVSPSTVGRDLATLGAGIAGAGFNVWNGLRNSPTTTPPRVTDDLGN